MNRFYRQGQRDAAAKYAALVVPTKVHESKIEGKGLFAAKDLPKGETVWRFDPKVDKDLTRKQVEASSPQRQKYLDTYASRVGDTFTLAGDDAKYMNHSEHANLKTQHSGEAPMKTTRPVRKGEELTANYREFDDDAREGKLDYVKKADELRRSHAPRTGPDHLKIKTVDGTKVRDNIDKDFTMGGNPSRYSYIPKGEMWVEKNLSPKDKASTVVHEAIEHRLMKNQGMSYEKAHDEANKSDKKVRDIYEKAKKQPLLYDHVRQR